ncbi:MAG: hypothetical protein MUD01_27150 [Chloroflexaceae bacterium]|nr:hypothetical protein [Chloroflexaceae bacterium]
MLRRLPFLGIVLALLLPLLGGPVAQAQQGNQRCFAETGQCISGPIRAYWERNGGLPVFGFPITPQREETVEGRTLQVQWFQRDRLEIQADGSITAGRLGARFLELQGRPWQPGLSTVASASGNCRFFPETGYSMCNAFHRYWERNGGLERFGYPITGEIQETIEGRAYTVQYFERRRLEFHPENVGTPFDVLLGLLGREVLTMQHGSLVPECAANINPVLREVYGRVSLGRPLGCPTLAPGNNVPAATQQMERGQMIWYGWAPDQPRMFRLNPRIFAISEPGPTFRTYDDRWVEGRDPDVPDIVPPTGLFAPYRGFGKVWMEDPELRQAIGWAIEPQAQARLADYQVFDSGIILVHIRETATVYAFGDPSRPEQVQVIRR